MWWIRRADARGATTRGQTPQLLRRPCTRVDRPLRVCTTPEPLSCERALSVDAAQVACAQLHPLTHQLHRRPLMRRIPRTASCTQHLTCLAGVNPPTVPALSVRQSATSALTAVALVHTHTAPRSWMVGALADLCSPRGCGEQPGAGLRVPRLQLLQGPREEQERQMEELADLLVRAPFIRPPAPAGLFATWYGASIWGAYVC